MGLSNNVEIAVTGFVSPVYNPFILWMEEGSLVVFPRKRKKVCECFFCRLPKDLRRLLFFVWFSVSIQYLLKDAHTSEWHLPKYRKGLTHDAIRQGAGETFLNWMGIDQKDDQTQYVLTAVDVENLPAIRWFERRGSYDIYPPYSLAVERNCKRIRQHFKDTFKHIRWDTHKYQGFSFDSEWDIWSYSVFFLENTWFK